MQFYLLNNKDTLFIYLFIYIECIFSPTNKQAVGFSGAEGC